LVAVVLTLDLGIGARSRIRDPALLGHRRRIDVRGLARSDDVDHAGPEGGGATGKSSSKTKRSRHEDRPRNFSTRTSIRFSGIKSVVAAGWFRPRSTGFVPSPDDEGVRFALTAASFPVTALAWAGT
jgi:hypothetical protein